MVSVGVLKESHDARVALVPEGVKRLTSKGIAVYVAKHSGLAAGHDDASYESVGAEISEEKALSSDFVLSVAKDHASLGLTQKQIFISMLDPLSKASSMENLAASGVTAFALELVPRISRAQSMDVLSSQANLAGYKAVLVAASHLKKIMPMLMTAAGTLSPAKVLILGAGVAGLQAIATARRLGAVVYAYDVRAAVKEQVESLGGKFVSLSMDLDGEGQGGYAKKLDDSAQKLQQEKLGDIAADMDIVVTTAQIPGRKAPRLLTLSAVKKMKLGSVIVDMAAGSGGNVEGSKQNEKHVIHGVTILGPTNLPSELSTDASKMFSKNMENLLGLMLKEGSVNLDFGDEIIKEACVCHGGKVVNDRVLGAL